MSVNQIFLNGELREIPIDIDLDKLLDHFSLPKQRVAIELNGRVVSRNDWPATNVVNNDKVEVVHFVGGG